MSEIALILLPNSVPNTLPPMLVYTKGVWRFMNAPDPGEPAITPSQLQERVNTRLDRLMKNEIDLVNPIPWSSVQGTCKLLYDRVIPEGVKDLLQEASLDPASILRIHTLRQHEWIPWEIMYDGQNFLGLSFQIARIPILTTRLDLQDDQPHTVKRVRHVLGQDVLDGTPNGLATTWQATFENLVPTGNISQKPGTIADNSDWPVVDDLADNRDFDIVHITCHGNMTNNDNERVWSLKIHGAEESYHYIDYGWLTQVRLAPSKSLVFGNACGFSGAVPTAGSLSPMFGPDFFTKGALNFIGSFAPLSKSLALEFAGQFYQKLLLGDSSIGKALLDTKLFFHNQPNAKDPSYLFYCLYGPPTTKFVC